MKISLPLVELIFKGNSCYPFQLVNTQGQKISLHLKLSKLTTLNRKEVETSIST